MAAGQYAAIGRCLWKWERPRQEVEPAPGPPLPNLHLWGVQVGRNGETPARTLQFLCVPEHLMEKWGWVPAHVVLPLFSPRPIALLHSVAIASG
jgi:hypothetical protein